MKKRAKKTGPNGPFMIINNLSGARLSATSATVTFRPARVGVVVRNGGDEHGMSGDEAIRVDVLGNGGEARWVLAERLRELASIVSGTVGSPLDGASIVILLRKKAQP